MNAAPKLVLRSVRAPTRERSAPVERTAAPRRAPVGLKKSPMMTWGAPVDQKSRVIFTRQLAMLLKAGLPLLRGLEVLARQEKRPAFKQVLIEIGDVIRAGKNFSDGLMQHPKLFDRLYVNMVRAGEAGGVLETVLGRLASFGEKSERIKGKIKAAMVYPAIITLVATAIVSVLMVWVVPGFQEIFSSLLKGQPLPALTQALLAVSYFLRDRFPVVLAGGMAAAVAFGLVRKSRRGIRVWDRVAIRVPVLGELVLKVAIARFTRTFGTLLASGVPMLQALAITRDTSGNVHVAKAIDRVHERVKEGDSVARPLDATGIFPGMVTSMIQVGEETGALPEMLTRIADSYDEEVDNAVVGLTSIIEPVMIVLMALVVGTIVIALFLPLVGIIQHLQ